MAQCENFPDCLFAEFEIFLNQKHYSGIPDSGVTFYIIHAIRSWQVKGVTEVL